MRTRVVRCCTLLVSIFATSSLSAEEASSPFPTSSPSPSPMLLGEALFKNLKARSIGPAVMGGRVSDIASDPRNPFVFYVALGHGGIFKTNDDGVTFEPIFDKQPMLSIGAIAVAPSDPDVVWVGTGEANDRNSSDWGDGVYRSTDGGERGLFKTTDAGKSWKLILHALPPHDAQTGCGDVALDPTNSQIVYAVLYARRRTPWSFTSGPSVIGNEDVGGIFKSTDGGATWKKLGGGLPGQTGRIGLSVSASNAKVVMAVVQSYEGGFGPLDDLRSKSGGVFLSEDGGETWTRMSAMDPRPFYFSQIRVDPANDQRVYLLGFALFV